MQLTPEQLDRLAAAGCDVPYDPRKVNIEGQPYYGQPTESAVMEFIYQHTGNAVTLTRKFASWDARVTHKGRWTCSNLHPLHALYALALAVGAVGGEE